MGFSNQFFRAIGVQFEDRKSLKNFASKIGVPLSRLRYYNEKNILPTGADLEAVINETGISELELMLKMGRLDRNILEVLQNKADLIMPILNTQNVNTGSDRISAELTFQTDLGNLYQGDCLSLMEEIASDSIDLIFADPPFNLNKLYPSNINDSLKTERYIHWCQDWLRECVRVLKNGGSFFLWNLPKWNAIFTDYLGGRLNFRHWIAVDIKYSLPIQGRLYPSHYSLLYYIKGERPNVFHPDRLPMSICPHCYRDLKDYGGYKDKMNPKGVNITDVWLDIPPVRHAKYKRRISANELSLKLLDRIIEMSSDVGDIILDPFGGSGTTYMAAELKGRKWLGVEISPTDDIIERFSRIDEERKILENYRNNMNALFTKETHKKRVSLGLWTSETFKDSNQQQDDDEHKQGTIDFDSSKLTSPSGQNEVTFVLESDG
ncbi:MAG: DNA-methyltransferase [Mastigocoleus sp.]